MAALFRVLQPNEGNLLKNLFVRMSVETPTAFAGTVAELEQRTNEEWQELAANIASSPNMEAFVSEIDGEAVGFVTGVILTKNRLALFEEGISEDESLSDTTMLGRMWVAPQSRGKGLAQALVDAVFNWAKERGQRRVLLAVSDGNQAAKRAYDKAKFIPTGHIIPHPNFPELSIHLMEYVF